MKFWLRWLANGIAIFLALYLVDSLLHERFHFMKTWPVVVAAIVLAFLNGFVRPLHRAKSRPQRAALTIVVTVLVNALILQLFVWVGADTTTSGFYYVLLAAAFVTLVAGLINWQVGFGSADKTKPGVREQLERNRPARPSRPARP